MGDIRLFLLLQTAFYPTCQSKSDRNFNGPLSKAGT